MAKAKILLAGMNRFPNQFSRYLDKMQCETIHIDGDPGGPIPANCAAVIITKCQISHEKFWKVKEVYKDLNKPVFITDFGITPIKERLEAFLSKLPVQIESKEVAPTVMARAYNKAEPPKNADANKIIIECYNAGFNIKDTLEMVEDLTQEDGSPYNMNYITKLWGQLGYKGKPVYKPAKTAPAPPPPLSPSPQVSIEPRPPQSVTKGMLADLVMQVLGMRKSIDEKAELIQRVLNRESIEEQVEVKVGKEVIEFAAGNGPVVSLNKYQARIILNHLDRVKEFVSL